jgi:hypothetical protein
VTVISEEPLLNEIIGASRGASPDLLGGFERIAYPNDILITLSWDFFYAGLTFISTQSKFLKILKRFISKRIWYSFFFLETKHEK